MLWEVEWMGMTSKERCLKILTEEVEDFLPTKKWEDYEKAINRVKYEFSKTDGCKPKLYKGKHIKDRYICGNCGAGFDGVGNNYCQNCGFFVQCTNQYNEFSEQLYPVNISNVKWVNLICDKYPNGCIQISCHDAQENAYYATRLLKCYVSKKGRYAIWGKHRFYEGYSGALILRGVPYKTVDTIKDAAKPYGTIVE